MNTHYLHCEDPWFSLIERGTKTVEGRKNLAKFKSYKPNDVLIFQLRDRQFTTKIIALRRYKTLEAYLKEETLARTLSGIRSIEDGVKIYHRWSTVEQINDVGFLAIEVTRSYSI